MAGSESSGYNGLGWVNCLGEEIGGERESADGVEHYNWRFEGGGGIIMRGSGWRGEA